MLRLWRFAPCLLQGLEMSCSRCSCFAASEGRGQSMFSAPLPSQKLRLDGHSDAPGSRVQPEDSLMSYRLRRTRRQQFFKFSQWHRGVKPHIYAPWLLQRASLPWSIDIGFLIASLTLLPFFCWQWPEARSPPGALALACQN